MSAASNTPQLAFALAAEDRASFDNFWVGQNSELVAALVASSTKGEPSNVYFYGAPGSGKSHLLFASIRLAKAQAINTSYLSLLDPHVVPDMLGVIDVKHLVCIDNVQAWAGDKDRERALFTLFEQIKHAGGQLLLSAQQPPESTGLMIRDLVSRLSSGLIYPLLELSDEQRMQALKMRATHRGISMGDDAINYLVSRSSRDTAALFTTLDMIDKASLVEQRRVTIPFLQKLLKRD